MKKLLAGLAIAGLLGGCATTQPVGIVYSDGHFYNGSTIVSANAKDIPATKTGQSCATSWLYLVALGDNSVETAKVAGGITKVATIDYEVKNLLGIYGSYCTIVKGN